MGLCCGRRYGINIVLRYEVRWRFLLMLGIRVKVKIVNL